MSGREQTTLRRIALARARSDRISKPSSLKRALRLTERARTVSSSPRRAIGVVTRSPISPRPAKSLQVLLPPLLRDRFKQPFLDAQRTVEQRLGHARILILDELVDNAFRRARIHGQCHGEIALRGRNRSRH